MKRLFLSLIIAVSLYSCTSKKDFEKGKAQLENMGYSEIENTGYSSFCCDDKDTYSTGFKCIDKKGNQVTGCFCSSLTKGVTIRFE